MESNVTEKTTKSQEASNLKKTAVWMTFFVFLVKALGLLRSVSLAYCYGTSNISDAFLIAFSIPSILFSGLGKAISTSYVPVFLGIEKSKGKEESEKYTGKIAFFGLIFCLVLLCVIEIFPDFVISVFANGFDSETTKICRDILRIGSISIVFMLLTNLFASYLQTKGHYIITSIVSLPLNVILISCIFFSLHTSYLVLGYGLLLAFASEFLLLIPFLKKNHYQFRPGFKIDTNIIDTFGLVLPILIGSIATEANHMIDKSIASTISIGGISSLDYASTINVSIQELLVTGLLSIIFVEFSKLVISKNEDAIRKDLSYIFGVLSSLLIPVTFICLFYCKEIITIFYYRGSFDSKSLESTSSALFFYSFGILFIGLKDVLVKVFYAYHDTKTPVISSIIAIAFNVGLDFLMGHYFGVSGLAAATSIASLIDFLFLFIVFNKRHFVILSRFNYQHFIFVFISAFVVSVFSYSIQRYFSTITNIYFSTIISLLIFAICYYYLLLFFGIKDIKDLLGAAFRGKKKNNN